MPETLNANDFSTAAKSRLAYFRARKCALRQELRAAGVKETTVYAGEAELNAWRELAGVLGSPLFSASRQLRRTRDHEDATATILKTAAALRQKPAPPKNANNAASEIGPMQFELPM